MSSISLTPHPKHPDALKSLVGCELVEVDQDKEGFWALAFRADDGEECVVWLLRDGEGNGPGWFQLQMIPGD